MPIPQDTLVKLAADQYYYMHLHSQVRQDNNFRAFLWLASFAIATALVLAKETRPSPESVTAFLLYGAMFVAMVTFLYCLWHMRGRGDVAHPDLKAFAALVPEEDEKADEIHFLWLINQYWDFAQMGTASLVRRTQSLRVTTYLLSLCFVLLTAAGIASVPNYFQSLQHQGGEITMAEQPARKEEEQPKSPPSSTPRNTEPPPTLERANNRDEGPKPETGIRTTIP